MGITCTNRIFNRILASVLLPRQNVFGLSNINSAFKLFSPLISAAPRPNSENPDMLIRTFSSCECRGGHLGNCVPSAVCNAYGGRPSGSCGALAVCCVRKWHLRIFLLHWWWVSHYRKIYLINVWRKHCSSRL
jgi:hypothetical protein